MTPALFDHQVSTVDFLKTNDNVLITSDPGTGKTRCIIEYIRHNKHLGRALVFAPKSILEPSWLQDIRKFAPELTAVVALANNRKAAFESQADVVLTNHDAVKWVETNDFLVDGFHLVVCDESTAYKNPTSQRSKSMLQLADKIPKKVLMSGTPNPNGIIDLWHQMRILDGGQRLGKSYWAFRGATHTPITRMGFTTWEEKEGIQDAVYGLIADCNIRYRLEDCLDIPENFTTEIKIDLSPTHRQAYEMMRTRAILDMKQGTVTAINAASLTTKLLQIAAGVVYGKDESFNLDNDRYELILDLIEARDQCVVAFNWGHQKEALIAEAKRRKIDYAVIDGETALHLRTKAVDDFQSGKIRVVFAHPASAGHGLTLTKGTTTIWASPTYNAEHYMQFNRRIYRAGQTQRTETIHISANNTLDEAAYAKLTGKIDKMTNLLELLTT